MNMLEFDERSGQADDDRAKWVREYLTTNGWQYTSRHPGSMWLWTLTKEAEGAEPITYAVQESVALQIQRYWELEAQHFNAHDADCPIFRTFDWDDCNCIVHEIAEGAEDDLAALDGSDEP